MDKKKKKMAKKCTMGFSQWLRFKQEKKNELKRPIATEKSSGWRADKCLLVTLMTYSKSVFGDHHGIAGFSLSFLIGWLLYGNRRFKKKKRFSSISCSIFSMIRSLECVLNSVDAASYDPKLCIHDYICLEKWIYLCVQLAFRASWPHHAVQRPPN